MAYIGQNADGNFTTSVSKDTFSGNGSTTEFTLSEAATTNTVDVFVENIRQEPTTAYTVDGTTLTFTAAPVTGTDNIYVVNRGPIQLSASHPAAQALTAHSATITTDLTVNTDTLFVDASADAVGIGTTSLTAARTLTVNEATAPTQSFEQNGTEKHFSGIAGSASFGVNGSASGDYFARTSGGKMLFSTDSGTTAHATLDGSGNLLVGKTSSSFSSNGVQLQNNGELYVTRDGGAPVSLNRKTSDGGIVAFAKDGTTVGSIGVNAQRPYIGASLASTDANIKFTNAQVLPCDATGANTDGTDDLGASNARFKDLYLGGGIQFDSRTNKLDDYEQGTWTAGISGTSTSGSITFTNTTGYYIKIGNLVHVRWYSSGSTVTTAPTGNTILTGLPFTPKLVDYGYSLFQYVHGNFFTSITTGGYFGIGQTYGYFVVQGSTQIATPATGGPKYIMIAGTYEAT